MTVKEMLGKLDSPELTEWQAFFRVEQAETENAGARAELANEVRK